MEEIELEDIVYEEELLRNPFSLKLWLRYISAKAHSSASVRNMLFERALHSLPGSYKLWLMYLSERKKRALILCITDEGVEALNNAFERALIWMHKMPRIWLEYLGFLIHQKRVTRTRRTFDRALRSLPVTQHDKIWKLYLQFGRDCGVGETMCRIYRRYLKFNPDGVEDFIEALKGLHRWDEAASLLASALNRDTFVSRLGKSKHQLWIELCDIITKYAPEIKSIKVEPVIRSALRKFSDETGRLWTSLADYYIRLGHFDKARDIFEEATSTIMTVRDFSVVYDAQTTFEETMIQSKMEAEAEEEGVVDDELDPEAHDLDLRLARLEMLIDRRPEMVSSVLLRQNPNNVAEWHNRVKIFQDYPEKVIMTFAEAVKTVDPKTTSGRPHTLWVAFAKYYEENDGIDDARAIFEKAVKVDFRGIDDLASVWCEWIEMELRLEQFDRAISLCERALSTAPKKFIKDASATFWKSDGPCEERVWQSSRLWSLYADLVENLRSLDATKQVYDRMMDLRVCSPQTLLNYAQLLEENKFFEESFKVFEKGVALFSFPVVTPLWTTYLSKFLGRYKGEKMERTRDLFEQVLSKVPQDEATQFYLMYAKFEEDYGQIKKSMNIYDRATKAVKQEDRYSVFQHYIAKAAEFFGVTKTRPIYEMAMHALPDEQIKDMAMSYIALERRLGEIDRARALFVYTSQYCDPRVTNDFWMAWHEFEVKHGNEDTFREMLRIKRSVQLEYAQKRMMTTDVAAVLKGETAAPEAKRIRGETDMERLEREAAVERALAAAPPPQTALEMQLSSAPLQPLQDNPEEIDLDGDTANDAEMEEKPADYSGLGLQERPVPDAVFGGIKAAAEAAAAASGEAPNKAMGARDRFRSKGK